MKKILLVIDGLHFPQAAFDFACRLNEVQPILLTGLFLPSIDYTSTITYYLGITGPIYAPLLESEPDIMMANIEKFKDQCEKNQIDCRVHDTSEGSILESIGKETRYSDLLLLSSELFYNNLGDHAHEQYLHETGHDAECPVMLVPEQFDNPKKLILAYDGSASSVFAIKQFAYLFPELSKLDAVMIYASGKDSALPDVDYIKELAARHFPSLSFLKLDADPRHYFNTWLLDEGPAILVTGAYGRSLLSEMFKKSFIHEIIREHRLPVFIAHR